MRLSKQLAVSAVVVAVAAMFLTASFIPALNDNQAAGEQEAVQYFADPASNDKKSDAIWVVDKILHGLADKTGGMIFVKQAIPDDAVIIKGNSTIADGKITGQDGSVFNSGDNKALVFKNANVTSDGSKVIVNNRSVFFTGDNTFTGPSETALNLDINSDYNYANGVFVGGVGIVPAPAGDAGTTTIASSSFTLHSYKDIHPTSEETYIVDVELALAGDSYDDFFSISFSGEGVETNMEIHNDDGIEFDLNVTFHTEDLIDYIVSDTSTDNIKTSLVNYFVNNEFSDDFEFFFGLNNLELSDTTTIIEADGDYYKKTAETNYALFSGITAEIEPGEGSVQTALNAVSSKVQFLMHTEDTDYYPDADCKEGDEIEGMSVYSLSELAVNGFIGTLAVTKDKGAYAELTVPNFEVTYAGQNGDVSTQAIMTVYNAGMKFWVD